MKRVLLTLFLLHFAAGVAQEEVLLTRQAEAHFQAKEYDQTIKLFQKLEEEKLAPWRHARLIYNMGTTFLEQESWQDALAEYSAVPYYPKEAPFLSRALMVNIAILQYRQASLLIDQEKLTFDEYSKAFYLYRNVLRNIRKAEIADCILQALIGKEYCQPSDDLIELRSAVKRELAIVTKQFGEEKIAESPSKEGIPFLLSGVKLALSHIDFLETKKMDSTLKKKYLKLFARDAESWLSLWEAQWKKMPELEEAQNQYIEAVTSLQQDRLDESRLALLSSVATLAELMENLWGIDPVLNLLQKLLTSYQRTLDQAPIQTPTLYKLQAEQKHLREVAETTGVSTQELTLSDEYFSKSLEFARQARSKHARFFLEEARQWIRRFLRQKILPEDKTPEEILEDAIQEQSHALILNHLNQEMDREKTETEELLQKSQGIALKIVEPFIPIVLHQEVLEFPERCQRKPWDRVIPLFNQGLQAAMFAHTILGEENATMFATAMQEEAVRFWKEALERMRKPEEEEKPPEEKEEAPPEKKDEETSPQEVLRLLQKMEQEDREPKPLETTPQEGIRPW
ncbi:MAG: hypothetical protein K940chlam7_00182 [Chlamydiae bacterium]|nr:hypothetical protein [Chlamydiota bacterium]